MSAATFGLALDAMLAGPLGCDVEVGAARFRAVLTAEDRTDAGPGGLDQPVWTTTLTVRDRDLPATLREGMTLTVAGVAYRLRRKGRTDDMGARELLVVEVPT